MTALPLRRQAVGFAGWLAISLLAGATGAIASVRAATFYGQLTQPSWSPPAWLFGPVWSVLYVLMGIAAWLVWRTVDRRAGPALTLFVGQLLANALWTWLFFVWHQGALALVEIVLLWSMIAATIVAFWRIQRVASVLLLPYLAWVGFATALTWSLWRANPAMLG